MRRHRDKYGWYRLHGRTYQFTDRHEYYEYYTTGTYISGHGEEFLIDNYEWGLYLICFEDGTRKYMHPLQMTELMDGATRISDKTWEEVNRFYMKRKEIGCRKNS